MKRNVLILAGALLLSATAATAAWNTANSTDALPQDWTMTAARGYGAQTADGNNGSAMCVECHGVNPSDRIPAAAVSVGNGFAAASIAGEYGTHFVMNNLAPNATDFPNRPFGTTRNDGGFTNGYDNTADSDTKYIKTSAWTNGALSKYNAAGTALLSTTTGTATTDLICESCHNILTNDGFQLLVGGYADNGNDVLCLGCHGQSQTRATGIAGFQGAGNLPAFAGTTVRKRHHVIGSESFATLDASYSTADGSIMWAPSFGNKVSATWCTSPGQSGVSPTDISSSAIDFRGACTSSGQGTYADTAVVSSGDISGVTPDTLILTCSNCHRPHNAMGGAGAFILRTGDGNDFAGNLNGLTDGTDAAGIRRQVDVGDYSTSKIYGEYRPLCVGCHRGY